MNASPFVLETEDGEELPLSWDEAVAACQKAYPEMSAATVFKSVYKGVMLPNGRLRPLDAPQKTSPPATVAQALERCATALQALIDVEVFLSSEAVLALPVSLAKLKIGVARDRVWSAQEALKRVARAGNSSI